MQTLRQVVQRSAISGQPCTIQAPGLWRTEFEQHQLSTSKYIGDFSDFSGDQRMLFKTINKLLQKQKVQQYPSCFPDSTSLADAFNNFFISKIDKIHDAFTEKAPENDLTSSHTTDRPLCDVQIHNFQQVTLDMVKKFAVKTSTNHVTLIHFQHLF